MPTTILRPMSASATMRHKRTPPSLRPGNQIEGQYDDECRDYRHTGEPSSGDLRRAPHYHVFRPGHHAGIGAARAGCACNSTSSRTWHLTDPNYLLPGRVTIRTCRLFLASGWVVATNSSGVDSVGGHPCRASSNVNVLPMRVGILTLPVPGRWAPGNSEDNIIATMGGRAKCGRRGCPPGPRLDLPFLASTPSIFPPTTAPDLPPAWLVPEVKPAGSRKCVHGSRIPLGFLIGQVLATSRRRIKGITNSLPHRLGGFNRCRVADEANFIQCLRELGHGRHQSIDIGLTLARFEPNCLRRDPTVANLHDVNHDRLLKARVNLTAFLAPSHALLPDGLVVTCYHCRADLRRSAGCGPKRIRHGASTPVPATERVAVRPEVASRSP